jgi:purine-nucleoside phosphorylase
MQPSVLDESVSQALASLERRDVQRPSALYLLSTGVGVLAGRLTRAGRLPFSKLEGVPHAWQDSLLHWGLLEGLPIWLVENSPLDREAGEAEWQRAWPMWLAAAAGASTFVHTCAGASLDSSVPPGTIALLSDHVNLSGTTPLLALGSSRLGAQFPDVSRVHDAALRRAAVELCRSLGLAVAEPVGACAVGPTIETPAERRWMGHCGAQVSAQELAAPLIAAAHAGLGGLSIVVVVHEGDDPVDIALVAARAEKLAPALDDLLSKLALAVQEQVRERLAELEG